MQLDLMTKSWFLTAGETDARGLMPITLITARTIELSTDHANALGIGYADLAREGMSWVLARVSIEMVRYPRINETYTMATWIEGYNRFFSDRCLEMTDADGHPLAYIRTMWVAIDIEKRSMADLSRLESEKFPVLKRPCPIPKMRAPLIEPGAETDREDYTFRFCDIDFNRHVNTVRYLDLVLNRYTLDFFDHNSIRRLDVSFEHECYYGERVALVSGPGASEPGSTVTEIHSPEQQRRAVAIRLAFSPKAELE